MSTFDPNKEITRPGSYGHSNNNFAFSDLRELRGASYVDNITELKSIPEDKRSIPFKCGVRWYDEANEGATSGGEVVYANYKGDDITDTTWTNLDKWELEGGGDNTWRLVNNTGLDFTDVTVDPSTNTISNDYGLTHGNGNTSEGFGAWAIGFNNVAAGVYSKVMGQNIQESLPNTTALGQNLIHGASITATDISESLIVGSFIEFTGDQLANTDNRGRGNVVVGVGGNATNPLVVTGQEQTVFHNISGNYTGQGIRGVTNSVIGGKDHVIEASSDPLSEDTRENFIAAGNSLTIGQDTQRSAIIAGVNSSVLEASRTSAIVCSEDSVIRGSNFSGVYSGFRNTMSLSGNTSIIASQDSDISQVTYGLITNSLNCDITTSDGVSIIGSNDISVTSLDRIVVLGLNGSSIPVGALDTDNTTYTDWLWINSLISTHAYADDAAAGAAGLTAGKLYRTDGTGAAPLDTAGIVMVKL